jgi:hypothetical protein
VKISELFCVEVVRPYRTINFFLGVHFEAPDCEMGLRYHELINFASSARQNAFSTSAAGKTVDVSTYTRLFSLFSLPTKVAAKARLAGSNLLQTLATATPQFGSSKRPVRIPCREAIEAIDRMCHWMNVNT